MKTARTAVCAVALLALATGCAKMMAGSEDGTGGPSTGMDGSSGSSGQAGGGSGATRAGRSGGGGMAERVPIKEFQQATELADIHFDFDRYEVRGQDEATLQTNAAWLQSNKNYLVLIEGHTDERGTDAYNVTLGDRRAKMTQNYLVSRGIDSRRISIISYGENRPLGSDASEDCWAKNRRAHFRVKRQ
jgi:peptidoglycan-associated lipoprotein